MKIVLKEAFDLFFWFFILIIVSFLIPIEFFLTLFYFFIFFFIFFIKLFLNYVFDKKIDDIKYTNYFKTKNFILKFFVFLLYDFPIKWSFFYFYNTLNFFLNNKTTKLIFSASEFYNSFLVFVKNFVFRFIFKTITTFSYLAYKNTNYIYKSFWDLKSYKINNKKIFIKTFLLNLMVDYNSIFLKIKSLKVKINNKKVILNPPKLFKKLIEYTEKAILSKTEANIGVSDLRFGSKILIESYNISKTQIVVTTKTYDDKAINQIFSQDFNNNNLDIINNHLILKKELELKSNPFFDSLNKKFKQTYSGYNEETDFICTLENYINSNKKDFDCIFENNDFDKNSFSQQIQSLDQSTITPVHIVDKNSLFNYDFNDFNIDLDSMIENKSIFGQTLAIFWDKPLYEKEVDEGVVILKPSKILIRDYFQINEHKLDFSLKNTVDSINIFYNDNKELYKPENYEMLKSVITSNIEGPFAEMLYHYTKKFEKSGQDSGDVIKSFLDDFMKK